MTERPILFTDPMVRAILRGTKTQTRRIIKHSLTNLPVVSGRVGRLGGDDRWWWFLNGEPATTVACRFDLGDLLWVREAWRRDSFGWFFRADYSKSNYANYKWKPSIHMPREASRLTLRVDAVSAEPLQQIDEEDARREGVSDVEEFRELWQAINGNWDDNPWVWVVEFSVC